MTDLISQWCARFRRDLQVTRWHYIESQIEDRLITHCGRQMANRNTKGYLLTDAAPAPTQKCERCAK